MFFESDVLSPLASSSWRHLMEKAKSGVWKALSALIAALVATASTPALADKGGRGGHLGAPNVDLGLSKFHNAGAGAGPFVPAPGPHVAPGLMRESLGNGGIPSSAASGASGLTPSYGMAPPGQLATPGLRLGHTQGAMPTAPQPDQPGNALTSGHRDDMGDGNVQEAAQGPVAATNRVAAKSPVDDQNASQGNGAMPRQLPTCR